MAALNDPRSPQYTSGTRPSPELRLLSALDAFRDALADVLVSRSEPVPPKALVTLTEAATRLGVARSTVTRWADSGRLRTVGPAHARRVPAAEIERLGQ